MAEEKIAKIFGAFEAFNAIQQERIVSFLGAYICQSAGRDLGLAESFLLKLTETPQRLVLKRVFHVVCGYIFVRKAKEQLDSQFH